MAHVSFLGLIPACVPQLPDGADTSYAWALTKKDFAFLYWKAKTFSFNSYLTISGADESDCAPSPALDNAYSLSGSWNRTDATVETDLICNPWGYNYGNASSGDGLSTAKAQATIGIGLNSGLFFTKDEVYYLQPDFSVAAYDVYTSIEPFATVGVIASNGIVSPPSSPTGILSGTCNITINGNVYSCQGVVNNAGDIHAGCQLDLTSVTTTFNLDISITDVWPYV